MIGKSNPRAEEQANRSPGHAEESDTRRLLSTLDGVFSTFRAQLRTDAPKPFAGNAKIAVDTFNDIATGLKFKSRPRAFTVASPQELSPTEVVLTWTDIAGNADGYRVERCEGHRCHDFDEIAQLASSERSFTDSNLFTGTPYRYRVIAFNFGGDMSSNIVDITLTTPRDER